MANTNDKDHKGGMTVAEAGRKGGETVRNERGREFYEAIGRKGGATVKAERGRAFYEEIGRKGGETVKAVVVLTAQARGQVDEQQIIDWARGHMAAYKAPRRVQFVEALP